MFINPTKETLELTKQALGQGQGTLNKGVTIASGLASAGGDINLAVKALRNNAKPKSIKHCAEYVRRALNEGGFDIKLPDNSDKIKQAKDYGKPLSEAGFQDVAKVNQPAIYPPAGYAPKTGDVVVIQPIDKHPSGHMAMYDGNQWISDWKQQTVDF